MSNNEPTMTTGADMVPLTAPPVLAVASMPMQMLQQALANNAGAEVLSKLLDLHERFEAMQARKEFDAAFASVKAEVGIVRKTGIGHQGKAYADLADIARALDPVIAKHGLSYRFRSQRIGNELVMTCIVCHRAGHFEENSLPSPLDTSGSKNAVQAVGSTSTYLQRYTLVQAFGLAASVNGDINDDDGQAASVKDGWPRGSIYQEGDYEGGVPEGRTKPKAEPKYTRTLNAAVTHADRARAMQDELRQCTRVPELDALAEEIRERQDYKNLPDLLKDYIWKTYAKCLDRLQSEVIIEPDGSPDEPIPPTISERATALRDGKFQDYVQRPSRKQARPPETIGAPDGRHNPVRNPASDYHAGSITNQPSRLDDELQADEIADLLET